MDIASLSMGLAQSNTLNDVGTLMLAKSLDNANTLAAGEVAMIDAMPSQHALETSVNPSVGLNIDVYA